jgi:hypothetical protein
MRGHFRSHSDQGGLLCRVVSYVSSQLTKLSGDSGREKCAIYKKALPFPTKRVATSTRNAEHIASHGLLC